MTNVDEVEHGRSAASAPTTGEPEDSGQSWLVRAVPGLILGIGLIAMAAAMLLAARSGVNAPVSKQVSIGPFDVLLVYSTPTPQLIAAGLLTALASVVVVIGLDAWAAKRVTHHPHRARDVASPPIAFGGHDHRPLGRCR